MMEQASQRRTIPSRLLLVDDDPVLLDALSGTLHNRFGHFQLDLSPTADEAIARLHGTPYDTVISDVNMPRMNGLELLGKVKQLTPKTPVILISGHVDDAFISKAFEKGVAGFIAKPIDREGLVRTIRYTLNVSRLLALFDRQQATISRAREHYLTLIERLAQSAEDGMRWSERLREWNPDVYVESPDEQMRSEHSLQGLSKKTNRHLAALDAFMLKTIEASRQTCKELATAEENIRRLAFQSYPPSRS